MHRRPDPAHRSSRPTPARYAPPVEAILETAHEAFVSIDEEGRIRAWNREAERTFGWPKELALGQLLRDVLIPHRFRERHQEGLRRFIDTGDGPLLNKRIEISALHRSGREIPVELTISPVRADGRWSVHAFLHDISERYRAGELQARLATLVEYSADAVVSRTPEGVITSWNPAAERLYGYSADEIVGRTIDPIVPPDRKEEARELAARALRGESIQGFETERVRKDGRRIDVSITISPIYDDAGRVSELAMFVRDISTSKETQRRLARASEELRRANELKSQFVAVVSHELRTPLTSILGFATTIRARWHQLAEQDKLDFLGLVESQAQRLGRLVDDVLLLSRLEAKRVIPASAPVDVATVARAVIAELSLGSETELTADAAPPALADEEHVHQILLNFLANANAYGEPPFAIRVEQADASVVVRVCDAGSGVAEAFAFELFDPYTRAEKHQTAGRQGSGLGLAIAKGLAEAAGGAVWYEPNEPHGARFCLRLPTAAAPQPSHDASNAGGVAAP